MLGGYRPGGLGEVQRNGIVGLDHEEMRERGCCGQPEDRRQERRRPPLVTARDDGVVRCTLTSVIVPVVLGCERSGRGDYISGPAHALTCPGLSR